MKIKWDKFDSEKTLKEGLYFVYAGKIVYICIYEEVKIYKWFKQVGTRFRFRNKMSKYYMEVPKDTIHHICEIDLNFMDDGQ